MGGREGPVFSVRVSVCVCVHDFFGVRGSAFVCPSFGVFVPMSFFFVCLSMILEVAVAVKTTVSGLQTRWVTGHRKGFALLVRLRACASVIVFFLCVGVCLPVMIIVSGVLDFGEDLDQKEHAILSGQRTRWGVGGGGKELVLSLFFCVLFVCPWELIAFASSFTPAPPHPSPPPPVHTAQHTIVPPFSIFFSAHLHPLPP